VNRLRLVSAWQARDPPVVKIMAWQASDQRERLPPSRWSKSPACSRHICRN